MLVSGVRAGLGRRNAKNVLSPPAPESLKQVLDHARAEKETRRRVRLVHSDSSAQLPKRNIGENPWKRKPSRGRIERGRVFVS